MKILLINNFFAPEGGAELSAYQTYLMLKEEGHEVAFFATDRKPYFIPDYEHAHHFPSYADFDMLTGLVSKLKQLPKLFYNLSAEHALTRLLREFQPDLVHCGNLHYHLSPAVLQACRTSRVPVVMTLRDVRLMCPAGTLMQNSETYCRDELCVKGSALNCIQHRCYDKSLFKSTLVTAEFYFRKIHRLYDIVDRFIAPSQALADLGYRAGIDAGRITVVNNFINEEYFQPQPTTDRPGAYFLYVGRLSAEKGLHTLIEAMANLPQEAQLQIAGTGPIEADLRQLVSDLKLTNVTFLGHLSGQVLRDTYQSCLAIVQPAEWFEVFGRTLVEAAAMGKPTVCTRSGGMTEIVDHNETGLLFPANDKVALTQHLMHLYRHPDEAVRMGLKARCKAEAQYSQLIHKEKLLSVYDSVILGTK